MTGIHARPGQSRDRLDTWTRQFAAWLGDARAWLRQLVLNAAAWRASRKARAAGLDAIAARELAAMRPDPDRLPAAGPPARQPEAAPSPPARLAPSPAPPGEGATTHPWAACRPLGSLVVPLEHPLMPGRPPWGRIDGHPRHDGVITVEDLGGSTTRTVIAVPFRGDWRETRPVPVVTDAPVVPRWYLAWLAEHPEAETAGTA